MPLKEPFPERIRKFTDESVSDTDIERLMRAVMAAPSAGNQQP